MAMTEINRLYVPSDVKAIVLDFDNTLVECIAPKISQHMHTAEQLGIVLTEDEIRHNWSRHSFTGLLKTLYGDKWEDANRLIIEQYDMFPKELYPDTVPTLRALGQAGYFLALMTSLRKDRLDQDFIATGIDPEVFAHIQTEKDTTVHKPNGDVFLPTLGWLASIGIKPSGAMYIGDAIEDMEAANSAGLNFVGVARGFVERERFEELGALSISSLGALILR